MGPYVSAPGFSSHTCPKLEVLLTSHPIDVNWVKVEFCLDLLALVLADDGGWFRILLPFVQTSIRLEGRPPPSLGQVEGAWWLLLRRREEC